MTQNRARPAGEYGGRPAPARKRGPVPHCVQAAVHDVQPSRGDPSIDGAVAQAELAQLRAVHDAMLVAGERRERLIEG